MKISASQIITISWYISVVIIIIYFNSFKFEKYIQRQFSFGYIKLTCFQLQIQNTTWYRNKYTQIQSECQNEQELKICYTSATLKFQIIFHVEFSCSGRCWQTSRTSGRPIRRKAVREYRNLVMFSLELNLSPGWRKMVHLSSSPFRPPLRPTKSVWFLVLVIFNEGTYLAFK